jgi:hypothetical protein
MSFEDWQSKEDELVRNVDIVSQKIEERKIENQVQTLFASLDINATRIFETTHKTSDFQGISELDPTAYRGFLKNCL